MKLFNLTDVETLRLKNAGLTDQSFSINGELLKPGESMEMTQSLGDLHYDGFEHLSAVGALHLGDEPPEGYKALQGALPLASKSQAPPPPKKSILPSKFPAADKVSEDEKKKED